MNSPITIVVTTWAPNNDDGHLRRQTAHAALASWLEYLNYDGEIRIHIADDGSTLPGYINELCDLWGATLSQQVACGVGASLNAGLQKAFSQGDLALYLVDDWMAVERVDLTPWTKLLIARDDIGMVRLGPPHPGLTGTVEMGIEGEWQNWLLRLDRHHYAYGMRPALYHRRFYDAYGPFEERCSSLECERMYNERFGLMDGPDIVLALPHPWQHIYGTEFSAIDPKERVR